MSRSRIKGITIEIGGDATGLDKALSGVNSNIRTTQTQLKDVNRLLKLDPGNINLLKQKKRLLGDEIKNTRSKLDQLKQASKQANAQLASGEMSQAQFEALQREIIATEQKLKQLENTAGSASARLAQISEVTGRFGERAQAAGRALMPLSAAATGFMTASVMAGASFEAALSDVRASTSATEAEMDKLTATARRWGRTSIYSATDVAGAMGYMGLAGWDAQQIYDGLCGVLNLAASAKLDLGQTTRMVTQGLTAFGMEASESGRFADVLATANKNANTSVTELGQAFSYVGPMAGAMGYSIEDVAVAIGLMADAGIVGSRAGTTLEASITALLNPSDAAAAKMEDLGIKMFDAEGNAKPLDRVLVQLRKSLADASQEQQEQALSTIFGVQAMRGMRAIVQASDDDFNSLTANLANAGGNAEKFAGIMNDNLLGQLKILKNTVKDVGIGIAEALLPVIRRLVEGLQGLMEWFSKLSPEMKSVIAVILAIVAAAGPLLILIGKIAMGISAVTGALSKLATIKKILIPLKMALAVAKGVATAAITAKTIALAIKNAVWKANPIVAIIMLIIAAIALFVKAIKHLWETNEGFRNAVIAVWNKIKSAIGTIVNAIKAVISVVWNTIKTIVTTVVSVIGTIVSTQFNMIRTIITTVMNVIKTVVQTAFNVVRTVIDTVMNVVRGIIQVVTSAITGDWRGAWEGMKNIVSSLIGGIVGVITTMASGIRDVFLNLISGAAEWGRHMIQGFISGIQSMIGGVADAVRGVGRTVRSFLGFTRPDKGPLHVYEEWMPHMMQGLAKGIRDNVHLIEKELNAVSQKMKMGIHSNFDLSTAIGPQTIYLTNTQITNLEGKPIAKAVTPTVIKMMTKEQNNQKAARGR